CACRYLALPPSLNPAPFTTHPLPVEPSTLRAHPLAMAAAAHTPASTRNTRYRHVRTPHRPHSLRPPPPPPRAGPLHSALPPSRPPSLPAHASSAPPRHGGGSSHPRLYP